VTETEKLLNAKHGILLKDVEALGRVRAYLAEHAQAERDARALLADMEGARQYEGVLNRLVSAAHDQLEEASRHTGWQPPQDGPLPIGDSIGHETLTTLGTPIVRVQDVIGTLVGQYVRLRLADVDGQKAGMEGFLAAVIDGFAIIEDRPDGETLDKILVGDIVLIEQWVAGGPNGTVVADHPQLLGDPSRPQDLPGGELRQAVAAEAGAQASDASPVSRTGTQSNGEQSKGRGRR